MTTIIPSTRKKIIAFFFIFLTLVSSNSCNYFVIKQSPEKVDKAIRKEGKIPNRYFMHTNGNVLEVYDLQIDKEYITGNLQDPNNVIRYTDGRSKRYKSYERGILNEIHFYTDTNLTKGIVRIPTSDIREIKVIDLDAGKTILSYSFTVIGISAAVFLVVAVIVALTKSSCPYVYVYNGTDLIFEGECFGGAIGPNMERDDYMPLPSAVKESGKYRIKINDELKEQQFTDLTELVVVEHPEGTSALLDKNGVPHIISQPDAPLTVVSYNGNDIKPVLTNKDNDVFMFDNEEYSKNGVIMKFSNHGSKTGKLLLKGKNTLWFDYIYGEFLSMFGNYYDTWTEDQTKLSYSDKMKLAHDCDIPLSISLKVNGEWQVVESLMTIGPLASRDFVIPINLTEVSGDMIEIKLETGFMFWEIDYAALDLTENTQLRTITCNPESAIDLNNRNWTNELAIADNEYMIQTIPGESTEIIFPFINPAPSGYVQSPFLHTQGYYTLIRDFQGAPQITELKKFKTPGYFSDFSKQRYEKWLTEEPNLAKY